MTTVDIRELKNRLSEHLRMVRRGEAILVTDRGEVVAELRQPASVPGTAAYPALIRHARAGKARIGAPNRPDLYPPLKPFLPPGAAKRLLDEERGNRSVSTPNPRRPGRTPTRARRKPRVIRVATGPVTNSGRARRPPCALEPSSPSELPSSSPRLCPRTSSARHQQRHRVKMRARSPGRCPG